LESYDIIVNLIANTRTRKGLEVNAALDSGLYPTGEKVPPEERALLNVEPLQTHPTWNYLIHPRTTRSNR